MSVQLDETLSFLKTRLSEAVSNLEKNTITQTIPGELLQKNTIIGYQAPANAQNLAKYTPVAIWGDLFAPSTTRQVIRAEDQEAVNSLQSQIKDIELKISQSLTKNSMPSSQIEQPMKPNLMTLGIPSIIIIAGIIALFYLGRKN